MEAGKSDAMTGTREGKGGFLPEKWFLHHSPPSQPLCHTFSILSSGLGDSFLASLPRKDNVSFNKPRHVHLVWKAYKRDKRSNRNLHTLPHPERGLPPGAPMISAQPCWAGAHAVYVCVSDMAPEPTRTLRLLLPASA